MNADIGLFKARHALCLIKATTGLADRNAANRATIAAKGQGGT